MEKDNKTMITAIMALLLSVGGVGMDFTDSSLDNYYICDVNYETGEFVRLSGTKYSAYPNEFDNKGYKRCVDDTGNKGKWYLVTEFANDNNINLEDLMKADDELTSPISSGVIGKQYICPAGDVGCFEVE